MCRCISSPRTSSTDGSTGDPWPCAGPCRALWSSTWWCGSRFWPCAGLFSQLWPCAGPWRSLSTSGAPICGSGPVQNCSCSSGPAQAVGGVCQQVGAVQAPISALGAGLEQALGDGVLSQPSPEKLEELRPRIVREAEENFVREANKLRVKEKFGLITRRQVAMSPQVGWFPQCHRCRNLQLCRINWLSAVVSLVLFNMQYLIKLQWLTLEMVHINVELQHLIKEWVWDGDSQRLGPLGTRLEFQLRNGWPMDSLKVLEVMDRCWILRVQLLEWWVKLNIKVDLEEKVMAQVVLQWLLCLWGLLVLWTWSTARSSSSGWTFAKLWSSTSSSTWLWAVDFTVWRLDHGCYADDWWYGRFGTWMVAWDHARSCRIVWSMVDFNTTWTNPSIRPVQVQRSEDHLRLEQRVVPMLLKCIPEIIKQDLIASRTMTATGIMYRLWTIFQPGGSSERVSILRQLTEPKVTGSASDLLAGLRPWRRLMSRSIELNLALPDPIILGGVLHRFAGALGKLGGTQVSYRVASVRQELAVDVRPVALLIEQYVEYLVVPPIWSWGVESWRWPQDHHGGWNYNYSFEGGVWSWSTWRCNYWSYDRKLNEIFLQVLEDYGVMQAWLVLLLFAWDKWHEGSIFQLWELGPFEARCALPKDQPHPILLQPLLQPIDLLRLQSNEGADTFVLPGLRWVTQICETFCMVPQWMLSQPTKRRWNRNEVASDFSLVTDQAVDEQPDPSRPENEEDMWEDAKNLFFWNLQPKGLPIADSFGYDLRS